MSTILIIGATGAMGSAVTRAFAQSPNQSHHIRAMTRDVDSKHAQSLMAIGPDSITLVPGDLNDRGSVREAMRGVDAVFCNTALFASGTVAGEWQHAFTAIDAARDAGVQHFVYSSLDPVSRLSGGRMHLPHYDSKAFVEADIDRRRSEEFLQQDDDGWFSHHVSVLVTCPYIENFTDFFVPQDGELSDGRSGKIFRTPIVGDSRWQMIALQDLAFFARMMIEDRHRWGWANAEDRVR